MAQISKMSVVRCKEAVLSVTLATDHGLLTTDFITNLCHLRNLRIAFLSFNRQSGNSSPDLVRESSGSYPAVAGAGCFPGRTTAATTVPKTEPTTTVHPIHSVICGMKAS